MISQEVWNRNCFNSRSTTTKRWVHESPIFFYCLSLLELQWGSPICILLSWSKKVGVWLLFMYIIGGQINWLSNGYKNIDIFKIKYSYLDGYFLIFRWMKKQLEGCEILLEQYANLLVLLGIWLSDKVDFKTPFWSLFLGFSLYSIYLVLFANSFNRMSWESDLRTSNHKLQQGRTIRWSWTFLYICHYVDSLSDTMFCLCFVILPCSYWSYLIGCSCDLL